ncbi:mitogen-activated protein kinase 15-like [Aotus nancymaae]|uniref:mitogen-activated protein kinase 15-like n=1 Tax=Aotus nancymaae TaxID=37293 RepID=UPI0030FEDDC6
MVGPLRGLFRHTLASCLLRSQLLEAGDSQDPSSLKQRDPGAPLPMCPQSPAFWVHRTLWGGWARASVTERECRPRAQEHRGESQEGPERAYGIVWKAVDRRTGEVVAIKKIFDAFRDKTDAQRTFREITLLQEFGEHPNIISLLDVIRAENDRDIYLVFECMGAPLPLPQGATPTPSPSTPQTGVCTLSPDTDLNAVIRKGGLLQDVHVRSIFSQLLRATRFLHSGHIVHRDQKPSNVLLRADCTVRLCDFGLARSLRDLPEGPEGQALTEHVATRWYRAPEVLLSSHRYTLGVDTWSLGCILAEMLRGKPLFPGTSTLHQLELILETIPPPSEEDLLALGSGCRASVLHHLGSR